MKTNSLEIAMLSGLLAVLVGSCKPSRDSQADGKPPVAKVTTRWKWTPKSMVGIPQGIIIEQIGDKVEASLVDLKDGDGFVVDRKISQGKYFADKREIVLPLGPIPPNQIDELIAMDIGRVVVPFTPEAQTLKARSVGMGPPQREMEFVRVPD